MVTGDVGSTSLFHNISPILRLKTQNATQPPNKEINVTASSMALPWCEASMINAMPGLASFSLFWWYYFITLMKSMMVDISRLRNDAILPSVSTRGLLCIESLYQISIIIMTIEFQVLNSPSASKIIFNVLWEWLSAILEMIIFQSITRCRPANSHCRRVGIEI